MEQRTMKFMSAYEVLGELDSACTPVGNRCTRYLYIDQDGILKI